MSLDQALKKASYESMVSRVDYVVRRDNIVVVASSSSALPPPPPPAIEIPPDRDKHETDS